MIDCRSGFPKAGIQNAQRRTVGDEDGVGVEQWRQASQVGRDGRLRPLEHPAHERQGVLLVPNKRESTVFHPAPVQ